MVPTARAQFEFTLFLITPEPAPPSGTGGATAAGVAACASALLQIRNGMYPQLIYRER